MNVVCGRGFFNTHNLELILNCSTLARRRGWDKSEQLSQFQCFSFDFSRTPLHVHMIGSTSKRRIRFWRARDNCLTLWNEAGTYILAEIYLGSGQTDRQDQAF